VTHIAICSRCGEIVREIPSEFFNRMQLDGSDDTCPECYAEGVIQVDADDDGIRVSFQADEKDGSPDCRCEECPAGGPYTCIGGKDD
jgi:hypothetical protein